MFKYDDIGEKIKGLAKLIFIIEAISAAISGLVLLFTAEDLILAGLAIIVCGPLVAWISSWLLYGFGEMIDKLTQIEKNTRGGGLSVSSIAGSSTSHSGPKDPYVRKGTVSYAELQVRKNVDNQNKEKKTVHFATRAANRYINCPNCFHTQLANKDCCEKCGVPFVYDDEQKDK